MRVAHFRESFSALSETFIYEYYTQHLAMGVDTAFYTFKRLDPEGRPAANVRLLSIAPWYHWAGLQARLHSCLPSVPRDAGGMHLRAAALQQAWATERPDIIHAHFGPAGFVACQAARSLDIPVVVSFYGYDASSLPRQRHWRERFALVFEQAGAILALSEEMKALLIQLGAPASKTHIVHLARNLSSFPYQRKATPLRRWLSVGRLTDKKGMADAIEAVGRLVALGNDLQFDIVGDGPLKSTLEALIRARNLQPHVRLLGALSNVEVMKAMREADAFLLCSKTAPDGDREGTPTVFVEAQAMGLPCVSTQHAGIPEMFAPSLRADLAPEGDVDAIVQAMTKLLSSSSEQLQARTHLARAYTEQEFAIQAQAQRLLDIYQQALTISA
jgi:colanic acid/amylovoran biosynthesis glycosyltransferase